MDWCWGEGSVVLLLLMFGWDRWWERGYGCDCCDGIFAGPWADVDV